MRLDYHQYKYSCKKYSLHHYSWYWETDLLILFCVTNILMHLSLLCIRITSHAGQKLQRMSPELKEQCFGSWTTSKWEFLLHQNCFSGHYNLYLQKRESLDHQCRAISTLATASSEHQDQLYPDFLISRSNGQNRPNHATCGPTSRKHQIHPNPTNCQLKIFNLRQN